jgi:riboflavin kinase/FMN adenylyltransferase
LRSGSEASRSTSRLKNISEVASPLRRRHADERFPPLLVEQPEALRARPRRVAIGNFDGVHHGHAAIIRGCDTVLTFDPHPLAVLSPKGAPKLLTTMAAKAELFAQLGVRELVIVRFDEAVARQSPEAFVQETLLGRLGAVHVSVGSNFHYGAKGAGDVHTLGARGEFTTAVADLVEIEDAVVSSSRIRDAVRSGAVREAARLLGRPHRLASRVVGVDRLPGLANDVAAVRLEFAASYACPPPGTYVCALQAAGVGGGRRIARAVEILPSEEGSGTVHARVSGRPDQSWAHEVSVEFLRGETLSSVAFGGLHGGAA